MTRKISAAHCDENEKKQQISKKKALFQGLFSDFGQKILDGKKLSCYNGKA